MKYRPAYGNLRFTAGLWLYRLTGSGKAGCYYRQRYCRDLRRIAKCLHDVALQEGGLDAVGMVRVAGGEHGR
ncbi:MAG: hypothetical protein ACKVUS_16905, partial [Saprospiraceae bacterium]